jgi:hypothetical protein
MINVEALTDWLTVREYKSPLNDFCLCVERVQSIDNFLSFSAKRMWIVARRRDKAVEKKENSWVEFLVSSE